jgi:hypothetical protein
MDPREEIDYDYAWECLLQTAEYENTALVEEYGHRSMQIVSEGVDKKGRVFYLALKTEILLRMESREDNGV